MSGDLWDSHGTHIGLIIEDSSEVVSIGEDLILTGQVRATAVNQIDAWEVVLHCYFLSS